MRTQSFTVLAPVLGMLCAGQVERVPEPAQPGEVQWIGEMRKVMRQGDLTGRVELRALADRPHLFAVGPLEGLRGEVTIWDGKPVIATLEQGDVSISREFRGRACFLVYAQVPQWQELDLPAGLDKPEALEAHLRQAARKVGIDTERPFPFLLRGKAAQVKLHIVNNTDDAPLTPEKHNQIKVSFDLRDREVEVIGFHSEKHAGVFTHHDSSVHMHLTTVDRKLSGHVDRITPGERMRLSLPRVEKKTQR